MGKAQAKKNKGKTATKKDGLLGRICGLIWAVKLSLNLDFQGFS